MQATSIGKTRAQELLIKQLNGKIHELHYSAVLKSARILAQEIKASYTFGTNWITVYVDHNPNKGDSGTTKVTRIQLHRFYTEKDFKLYLMSLGITI